MQASKSRWILTLVVCVSVVFIPGGKSSNKSTGRLLPAVSELEMVGLAAQQTYYCSEHISSKSSEHADTSAGRKSASYIATRIR